MFELAKSGVERGYGGKNAVFAEDGDVF